MDRWAIDIDRDDIAQAAIVADPEAPLPEGAIEVAIDLFALTANNVTYAALGKPSGLFGNDTGYWDFFADREAPGRLPVWGFATVTRSDHPGIEVGEQLYGYWPLASHAVLLPDRVNAVGFTEITPRRTALPALYNQYQRVSALIDHDPADHDWWPVYRPLYLTGWLIADQMEDNGDYGAEQVVIAAASSKTALGFAHAMRERDERPDLIALVSPASEQFVRDSKLYDRVVRYGEVVRIDEDMDTAFIDFAGDPKVTRWVHDHFGTSLHLSLIVGKAHWDADNAEGPLSGPKPTGFFAPAQLAKRSKDWGGDGLRERIGAAWKGFMPAAKALTAIDRRKGPEAALAAYQEAVAGKADPAAGIIIAP
jgi:hypothetical protein